MGERPPIERYCSVMAGVRRLEIKGPNISCNGPNVIISPSENKFFKKGPTSSKLFGPPIFNITTAVLGLMVVVVDVVEVDVEVDMREESGRRVVVVIRSVLVHRASIVRRVDNVGQKWQSEKLPDNQK